jgi:HEAT repeat protein
VKERALDGYTAELAAAFTRFLENAAKTDPGCNAKLGALEALDVVGHTDPGPFVVASRHVQLEAAWGPRVDSAGGVRARAILALAHMGYPDLLIVAGELLGDAQPGVRLAAAEALGACGDRSGAGLLLLASRRGEEDPVVQTAYMSALLAVAAALAAPRLRALLFGEDDDPRELAAIALGQSGREDAAGLLIEYMEATPLAAERAIALRGLGLHRSDRALEVLLAVIADGGARDAAEAVKALSARRFDPRVRERVAAAVARAGHAGLDAVMAEAFPADEG